MDNNKEVYTRDSLKVKVLTQRIATLVAQYEEQLADLRAQATLQLESLQEQVETLREALNEAQAQKSVVLDERVAEIVDVEPQENSEETS